MAKVKTTFYCQNCGAQSAQWMGKCKSCGEWNTITEKISKQVPKNNSFNQEIPAPKLINQISLEKNERIKKTYQRGNR